jgi:hypothetical protein
MNSDMEEQKQEEGILRSGSQSVGERTVVLHSVGLYIIDTVSETLQFEEKGHLMEEKSLEREMTKF